ncbi:MAG: hypothetical protein LBK99_06475 [Opitutaceae bacterium]|jgi:hypothetical protein|nr:hypothetical protein [Opitutaceae bacterium]
MAEESGGSGGWLDIAGSNSLATSTNFGPAINNGMNMFGDFIWKPEGDIGKTVTSSPNTTVDQEAKSDATAATAKDGSSATAARSGDTGATGGGTSFFESDTAKIALYGALGIGAILTVVALVYVIKK